VSYARLTVFGLTSSTEDKDSGWLRLSCEYQSW